MRVAVIGTGFGKHAAPAFAGLGSDCEVVSPRDEHAVLCDKPFGRKELGDSKAIGEPTRLNWSFPGSGLRGRELDLIDYPRWLFGSEVTECGDVTRTGSEGTVELTGETTLVVRRPGVMDRLRAGAS